MIFYILVNLEKQSSTVSIRDYSIFVIVVVALLGIGYYLFSVIGLPVEEYRSTIVLVGILVAVTRAIMVARNSGNIRTHSSRKTRKYVGNEPEKKVYNMYESGKTVYEIAVLNGITVDEVEQIVEKYRSDIK